MSHHTYSTICFVVSGVPVGENNRYLTLFTRELGLVRAVGKSLRSSHSKLRHHLQDYSLTHITLVRGRDVWRITGAHGSVNFYTAVHEEPKKQLLVARTCSLLSRLLQGEESPEQGLFDLVHSGFVFLQKTSMEQELIQDFEYVFIIRILAELGYVGEQRDLSTLLSPSPFSRDTLAHVALLRMKAIRSINKALEASGW